MIMFCKCKNLDNAIITFLFKYALETKLAKLFAKSLTREMCPQDLQVRPGKLDSLLLISARLVYYNLNCPDVCVFVDTKTSTLIEVDQHMSSISYV